MQFYWMLLLYKATTDTSNSKEMKKLKMSKAAWCKFVHKSRYRDVLLKAIQDLQDNNLADYDVKPITGMPNHKRIRIGSIRILFIETEEGYKIIEINNRGDMY